jgi:tRNA-binding protein
LRRDRSRAYRSGRRRGADRRDPRRLLSATIAYADFAKVDIRAGTIVAAEGLEGARTQAFVLEIDFGPEIGVTRSSAQITVHYAAAELVGCQVAAVVNFAPKRIAGVKSEVLVLGFPDAAEAVVLVAPTSAVPNGARLF